MIKAIVSIWLLGLMLTGCGQDAVRLEGGVSPTIPAGNLLADQVVKTSATLPDGAGVCYSAQVLPAIIETVTEQTLLTEAEVDPNGAVVAPATYQTQTQQRMVKDRQSVQFQVPCPALMDTVFIETLQRALKVRGLYAGAVTGEIDSLTGAAIRRYQAPQGLDSSVLSLAAARQLGLVAFERDALS